MITKRFTLRLMSGLLSMMAALLIVSCQQDDDYQTADSGVGYITFSDINVKAEIGGATRAFDLAVPNTDDLQIDIISSNGNIYKSGKLSEMSGSIRLISDTYSIRAYYGDSTKVISDVPFYLATTSVEIKSNIGADEEGGKNNSKKIELNVKLQSSAVYPQIIENSQYLNNSLKCVVKSGDESVEISKDETTKYLLPNKKYEIYYDFTSQYGKHVQLYDDDFETGSSPVVRLITFNLKLRLPSQDGGVWAKRFYFTPIKSSSTEADHIEYQFSTTGNDDDWETITTKENGYLCKAGLTPDTKYYVRAKLADLYSDVEEITTESTLVLPNNSFENWYSIEMNSGNWYKYYPWSNGDDTTKGWDTVNQITFQTEGSYQYLSISGTMETDGESGKGALIRTVGWGATGNNTAGGNAVFTKWEGTSYNKTPGELYLGTFDSDKMTPSYGLSFKSRPNSVSFYYKYTPCNTDKFVVNVVVENRADDGTITELASGSFTSGDKVEEYKLYTIGLSYTNVLMKATHFRVEFKSGTDSWSDTATSNDSLWNEVPPKNNLSSGKYVGSQLYVDDVELTYE